MNGLDDVCCACLPAAALPLLAGLRTLAGMRAWPQGERVWLRWEPGREEVLHRLLPIEGIELFARRDNLWYRPGQALPTFTVHVEGDSKALAQMIVPVPVEAEAPADGRITPLDFRLVRDDRPRQASALCCALADLARWADHATTQRMSALQAACSGTRVLVLGALPPPIPDAARYWGQRVLTPLGWRPEPLLSEKSLVEALGLTPQEIVLLHPEGIEVVPLDALTPLSRAGLRLALQGRPYGPG